jgi:hypothetical protein
VNIRAILAPLQNPERRQQRDLLFIFALAFLFRVALLLLFPVPYGNDAAGRLYFRDTLWTWHWLPVTQALVYASFATTQSIGAVRLVFAAATSLAAMAFTFYLQTFASRRAALIGGVVFATNSLLVFLSLMPYQEVVFLGLLFGSLAFFNRDADDSHHQKNFIAGAILYGLACLTRYEAWFLLPALLFARTRRALQTHDNARGFLQETVKDIIALCWGPTLWLFINWHIWGNPAAFLFHRADRAFYAWAPHGEIMRIINYLGLMLYWLACFGSPLALLALPGAWVVWKNRKKLVPVLWPSLLLLALELAFLIFVAGREFATANRFASVPVAILLIFVALGANALLENLEKSKRRWLQTLNQPAFKMMAASFLILFLLSYGAMPVAQANKHPDFREPYEVARFLAKNLAPNERAVIVGESIDGAVPMPYQRIFGQLAFDNAHLLCSALLDPRTVSDVEQFARERNLRYIAVFGKGWPRSGSDEIFLALIEDSNNKARGAFKNNAAVVYELE